VPNLPGNPYFLRSRWYDPVALGQGGRDHAFALVSLVLLSWAPPDRSDDQSKVLAKLQAKLDAYRESGRRVGGGAGGFVAEAGRCC
jgi:hypothetical protein